ncbi:MAG TPA: hypothetical protein VHS59_07270 [Bacillota bacterium]|nr:hypothetical protein [Bacillota bacterium]
MMPIFSDQAGENTVEIRAFSFLKPLFDQRGWTSPLYLVVERECSIPELVATLDLPMEKNRSSIH